MTKKLAGLVAVLAFAASTHALAHGGHQHLMGTVTKLEGMRMELKSTDGKIVAVSLTKGTKYFRDSLAVKASDVEVGSRVVIDLDHRGNEQIALEVKIGAAPKSAVDSKP